MTLPTSQFLPPGAYLAGLQPTPTRENLPMAMDPRTRYPGQIDTPGDGSYPYGRAKNVSAEGAGDGTPWEQDLANDLFGVLQGLLVEAGITPSGVPDQANASQYLESMRALARRRVQSEAIASVRVEAEIVTGDFRHLYDVCYGHGAGFADYGAFVAVGISELDGHHILSSQDGRTWNVDAGTPAVLLGCAHGGEGDFGSRLFLFVGRDTVNRCRIFSGADDLSGGGLTDRTPTPQPQAASRHAVWAGTQWVVVGEHHGTNNAQILTTDDFSPWTVRTPASGYTGDFHRAHLVQAGAQAGRVIAGGTLGELQYSDDEGATWTRALSLGAGTFSSIVEAAGVLLASTSDGVTVMRSSDGGTTWTAVSSALPTTPIEGVTVGVVETLAVLGEVVAAVLKDAASEKRVIAASFDLGQSWPAVQRLPPALSASVHRAAASDGNRVVFVGGDSDLDTYGFASASTAVPMSI